MLRSLVLQDSMSCSLVAVWYILLETNGWELSKRMRAGDDDWSHSDHVAANEVCECNKFTCILDVECDAGAIILSPIIDHET